MVGNGMFCAYEAEEVWNSLPSFVRTADSFTSFRSHSSRLVRKTFVADLLSAPLIPLPGLRVIKLLLNYLLKRYLVQHRCNS